MGRPLQLALLLSLAALPSTQSWAEQAELIVQQGETYRVTAANSEMTLQRLMLHDGARIEFSPEVKQWRVTAQQAQFEGTVHIDGRGNAGVHGQGGVQGAPATGSCEPGQTGVAGGRGEGGSDGVSIELTLGIIILDRLIIDTSGGAGGAGGSGGNGSAGGPPRRCNGAAGGNGGAGGSGGKGGHAGAINLHYWIAADTGRVTVTNYGEGVTLYAAGGGGGAAIKS